jgi:predicted nucleic acid-binding protein
MGPVMATVIADTSGLYALVDRRDPHHQRAADYLKTQAAAGSLLISNHVFDETMTLVKKRLGIQVALQLGIRLRNSRFVDMVIFSAAEEQETWRVFSRYSDKDWSYTDCACLVLAQQRNLQYAFAVDHHFRQMGLVPVI